MLNDKMISLIIPCHYIFPWSKRSSKGFYWIVAPIHQASFKLQPANHADKSNHDEMMVFTDKENC